VCSALLGLPILKPHFRSHQSLREMILCIVESHHDAVLCQTINLTASPGYDHSWWGRVIFRVDHVDAHYRALQEQGLRLESPRDAAWGERFFHVTDPDGHELSFAELLPVGG
jgi:catechol 2,3-dioxygenase-like lactoylglutathione lyase family enzyme